MGTVTTLVARHRGDVVAALLILFVLVAVTSHWAPRSFWSPDALFYRTNLLEIRGASEVDALDEVWTGPLSAPFRAADALREPSARVLADPEWIPYTAEFFERRQVVPALGAMLEPIAGEDGLEAASVLGAFVFAFLLYALLRTRFDPLPSAVAVVVCIAWPPFRWAFMPLTESWGLVLMTLSLLAAVMFIDHDRRRWLVIWALAILALGFTRDFTPVPILAAGVLWLAHRDRPALTLGIVGVAAALPAPLLLGAPLREQLAYGLSGRQIPGDASWSFVLDHYPAQAETAIRQTGEYLFQTHPRFLEEAWPLWPLTLVLLAGIVALVVVRARAPGIDPFLPLMWGGLAGGLVTFALNPFFTHYRYQLVLLPMAAAGVAIAVSLLVGWLGGSEAPDRAGAGRAGVPD